MMYGRLWSNFCTRVTTGFGEWGGYRVGAHNSGFRGLVRDHRSEKVMQARPVCAARPHAGAWARLCRAWASTYNSGFWGLGFSQHTTLPQRTTHSLQRFPQTHANTPLQSIPPMHCSYASLQRIAPSLPRPTSSMWARPYRNQMVSSSPGQQGMAGVRVEGPYKHPLNLKL